MDFEKLITTLSTNFINLASQEIDQGINRALQLVGEFTQVDRSYVFLYTDGKTNMNCIYEWCAEGVQPQIQRLKNIPVDSFCWSNQRLLNLEVLHIPDVMSLPEEARVEKVEFQRQDIQSLVAVPMAYQGDVVGFLGFDAVQKKKTWSNRNIALLKIVGEMFVNAMEHKRAQEIQAGQRQFLELLASGGSFSDTLHALVRVIEEQWPGLLGLILLLDEDGKHLHYGAAISLPEEYLHSIEGLEIGPQVGSCGTASYRRERVIVTDIASDPRWEGLRDLALKYGLRACWSEPVVSTENQVLGTFAMYYRYPRYPTEAELQTIETAAHLVGIAIEHRRAQEKLEAAYQTLEQRVEDRTRELATLFRVQQVITSQLDAGEVMQMIAEGARQLTSSQFAGLYHLEGDFMRLAAMSTADQRFVEITPGYRIPLDRSVAGLAVRARKPILVTDVATDDRVYQDFIDKTRIRSFLVVPLMSGTQPVGVLTVADKINGKLGPEDERVLTLLAASAAIGLENARLHSQALQRVDEAQTLFNVQQAITSRLDPDAVLQMIAAEARRLTGTDQGAVYLLIGNELEIAVISGEVPQDMLGVRLPVGNSVAGFAIQSGKPVRVLDAGEDSLVYHEVTRRVGAQSFLIVPLLGSSGPLGTITVANKHPGAIGPDAERILTMLASGAVIALENARLYQGEQQRRHEAERRRQVAEGLREILTVLNSNRLLEDVLNHIVVQARQLLNASATLIHHTDIEHQVVTIEASCCLPSDFDGVRTLPIYQKGSGDPLLADQPVIVSDLKTSLEPLIGSPGLPVARRKWAQAMMKYYQSFLSAPLFIKGELYGILTFYYQESRAFSEEDIQLAMVLGDQAAMAIENARLRSQVEKTAIATERNRLARDLHDAVTQTLFSASLIAEVLPRLFDKNREEGLRRLEELRQLTRGALAEMRTLLLELRPSALEEAEPDELFRHLVDAFTGRTRVPVHFVFEGNRRLPAEVKVVLYRIAQEALNNIAKHAGASDVTLRLVCHADQVTLYIQDDGQGFIPDHLSPEHLGLSIMKERAESVGADLVILSEIGEGTRVLVSWPGEGCTSEAG